MKNSTSYKMTLDEAADSQRLNKQIKIIIIITIMIIIIIKYQ